jgi:hypothetical protein
MVYSTVNGPKYRVQICMTYNSRSTCKTVSAKSEEAAVRGGISNACADIASGVTESMGCERTEPTSVKWLQKP